MVLTLNLLDLLSEVGVTLLAQRFVELRWLWTWRFTQIVSRSLLWPLVAVYHIHDLAFISHVRYQLHRELQSIVQHVLLYLLSCDLDGLYYIFQILFLRVQVTQRKVEAFRREDVDLLTRPNFFGLLAEELPNGQTGGHRDIFWVERFRIQGVRVQVLLNPSYQLNIHIFICTDDGVLASF